MAAKNPLPRLAPLAPAGRAEFALRIALAVSALATAALAAAPPPINAWLRPADRPGEQNGFDPQHGAFVFEGAPLRNLVAAAWGAHERDVQFRSGLDGDALYAAYARPPRTATGPPFSRAQAQLRAQLRRTLGLAVRTEQVDGPVQVLRRISSSAWQLRPSTHAETRIEARAGLFRAQRASMTAFVRFVRSHTTEPVVDETGLDGVYDFVMEWDPRAEQHALHDAFGDIGLALEPDRRSHPQLVVEPAAGADGKAPPGSADAEGAKR